MQNYDQPVFQSESSTNQNMSEFLNRLNLEQNDLIGQNSSHEMQ